MADTLSSHNPSPIYADVLKKICADKWAHIRRNQHLIPEAVHAQRARMQLPPRGFCKAIEAKKRLMQPALITEVKKASPSKGIIRMDFDPVQIARAYQSAGATCISVLTDQPYFKGTDEDLEIVRDITHIPLLRKDFMLTHYQITESRALGADCILLIVAALEDTMLRDLYNYACDLGMDVLIEVHDKTELERALVLDPMMIGVNARNLKTLDVSLETSLELCEQIPVQILRVAESGINNYNQLSQLHAAGFDAFLIGESLMRERDVFAAVKKMLGEI